MTPAQNNIPCGVIMGNIIATSLQKKTQKMELIKSKSYRFSTILFLISPTEDLGLHLRNWAARKTAWGVPASDYFGCFGCAGCAAQQNCSLPTDAAHTSYLPGCSMHRAGCSNQQLLQPAQRIRFMVSRSLQSYQWLSFCPSQTLP